MALKKSDLMDLYTNLSMGLSPKVKGEVLAVTGRGGQSASRDYISANCLLAEYRKANPSSDLSTITSKDELWNGIHPATRFRLKMYTPCLAFRYDALKPEEQKALFSNKNIIFTEKINGCRGIFIYHKGTMHLYSRNYSDRDCGLLEYWDNIAQDLNKEFEGIYAVDVEILFQPGADIRPELEELGLETDSPLEAMVALLHTYPDTAKLIQNKFKAKYGRDLICFKQITPLYFEGKNYLTRPLGDARLVYDKSIEFGRSLGLNIEPISSCAGTADEKEIFLNAILNKGGEGVVCYFLNGDYNTSENRSKTSFVKIKRTITAAENGTGLGDTIDAFVTGFKVGSNGTANEGFNCCP